ncbi:MAG TPA: hypothetical protein VFT70_00050 [Nocardioides sp.]|nr:hypothetical protein [Nocardioides sp.]
MFSKTTLMAGFAAGYVLGARAGRERYEQIKAGATRFAQNPKVQAAADKAQDAVGQQASSVVDAAKEKVSSHS